MTEGNEDANETLRAAAAAMGRKGGRARADSLSPSRRREIAMMGVKAHKANAAKRRRSKNEVR